MGEKYDKFEKIAEKILEENESSFEEEGIEKFLPIVWAEKKNLKWKGVVVYPNDEYQLFSCFLYRRMIQKVIKFIEEKTGKSDVMVLTKG